MTRRLTARAAGLAVPLTLLVVVSVVVTGGAVATNARSGPLASKVVLFASDGMRPDLMEKYAAAGAMPTYKKLMKDGATGDNGMLQAFPPNTGVG